MDKLPWNLHSFLVTARNRKRISVQVRKSCESGIQLRNRHLIRSRGVARMPVLQPYGKNQDRAFFLLGAEQVGLENLASLHYSLPAHINLYLEYGVLDHWRVQRMRATVQRVDSCISVLSFRIRRKNARLSGKGEEIRERLVFKSERGDSICIHPLCVDITVVKRTKNQIDQRGKHNAESTGT